MMHGQADWKTTEGRRAFNRGLGAVFEVLAADRERTAVVLGESGGPEGKKVYARVIGALVSFAAGQIRRGVDAGLFRDVDPDLCAWCVVGALELEIVRWAVLEVITKEQLMAEVPQIADLLWAMLGASG